MLISVALENKVLLFYLNYKGFLGKINEWFFLIIKIEERLDGPYEWFDHMNEKTDYLI